MMMTRTQYRSPQPKRKRPIIRTAVAWVIFFATMASTAFGVGREIYEARAKNFWQTLLIQGKPAEVRFICGTDLAVDCNIRVTIHYQEKGPSWCEYLLRSDKPETYKVDWCASNPELGTLTIFGTPHSFDRFGVVKRAGKLVGQLFLPGSSRFRAPMGPPANQWLERLSKGENVLISLTSDACGVIPSALRCEAKYSMSLHKIDGRWCEDVRMVGVDAEIGGRCNAPIEDSLLSLSGALFSFDGKGDVFFEKRLVGRLEVGPL
jgi:hypothetical protein